jgi:hypothetical protein
MALEEQQRLVEALKMLFALALLLFEQCMQQTPPFLTGFVHPSMLQRFVVAPCVTHTPPLKMPFFAQPSWLHRFCTTFGTMHFTYSYLHNLMVIASLKVFSLIILLFRHGNAGFYLHE